MWASLGQALPQAIGIAISPIPLALLILVLVSGQARTGGPAFAVGFTTGVFIAAGVAFAVSDRADVGSDPTAQDGGSLVQVILSLMFVALTTGSGDGAPDHEPSRVVRLT